MGSNPSIGTITMPHKIIDCRGLKCPLPILHTRLALNSMKKGEILEIESDDLGFIRDFKTFCFQADLKVLQAFDNGDHIIFVVELLK